MEKAAAIPLYRDINEFLAAAGFRQRASNPNFLALRLEDTYPDVRARMPPFRKEFFLLAMGVNPGDSAFQLDDQPLQGVPQYLAFQSPGHVLAWQRAEGLRGYLLYFRDDLFGFFRKDLLEEFPFFDLTHRNFFPVDQGAFDFLKPDFEELLREQENSHAFREAVIGARLLALLYKCRSFYAGFNAGLLHQNGAVVQAQRFVQLVNNFYLEKRTVEEYAALLHITPGHLSDLVRRALGKTASAVITEKLVREAKTLLRHTVADVAQIAWQLNFASPAHFNRFFKRETGLTPLAFRRFELSER